MTNAQGYFASKTHGYVLVDLPGTYSLTEMKALFVANGWTWVTAVCTILFSLNHWPCPSTLLTIRKETGSTAWTALAAAIPTAVGVGACMLVTAAAQLLG